MAQLGNTTFTGNVIGQLATFTKLIKDGLDDTSVLLAGGGHKALSEFSLSTHTHDLTLVLFKSIISKTDFNNIDDGVYNTGTDGNTTSYSSNLPNNGTGTIIWSYTPYKASNDIRTVQLSLDGYGRMYVRGFRNANYPWYLVYTSGNLSFSNGLSLSSGTVSNSGVRAISINGNNLRVNTNGTNNDLTIPFSTSSTYATYLGDSTNKLSYSNLSGVSGRTINSSTAGYVAYYSAASTISGTGLIRFDTTNSRVGINKTPGSYTLDVNGSAYISGNTYTGSLTSYTTNNSISGGAGTTYLSYSFHTRAGEGGLGSTATRSYTSVDGHWGTFYLKTPYRYNDYAKAGDKTSTKTTTASNSSYFFFRQYSFNSSTGARLANYEDFSLPSVTADRTSDLGYTIWTSKAFANNSSNWNTAYGWGNHASAGYVKKDTNTSITIADNYYTTSGTIGSTTMPTSLTTSNGWRYSKMSVTKGDKFLVRGRGGSSPRLFAFYDSSNKLKQLATDTLQAEEIPVVITAEQDGTLIVNFNKSYNYSIQPLTWVSGFKVINNYATLSTSDTNLASIGGINITAKLPTSLPASDTNLVKLYTRAQIGTSPNYDNPGVNGLFEIRMTKEVTGETGVKPLDSYYPILSLKSENVMLQIAGSNGAGFYIRGTLAASVTMSNVDWNKIVLDNDSRLTNTRNTTNSLTFNNGGSGAASGTTFNGSAAKTISYNTVGAAAASHTHTKSLITDFPTIPTSLPANGGTATYANLLNKNLKDINYKENSLVYTNLTGTTSTTMGAWNTPSSTSTWWHELRFCHGNEAGYYTNLAIPFNANSIYYQRWANGALQNSSNNRAGWVKVLDELNWTDSITLSSLGAAAASHTHSYLPLSGGTLTGNLTISTSLAGIGNARITLNNKNTTDNKTSSAYIAAYYANENGANLVINPAGNLFIGSGESAYNMYALKTTDTGEVSYIMSDNLIYLYSNCLTIGNRIGILIDNSGHILPYKAEAANNNLQNIGASNNKFANIYATKFHGTSSLYSNTIATSVNAKYYKLFSIKYTSYNYLHICFNYRGGYGVMGTAYARLRFANGKTEAESSNFNIINDVANSNNVIVSSNGTDTFTFWILSSGTNCVVGYDIIYVNGEGTAINDPTNNTYWTHHDIKGSETSTAPTAFITTTNKVNYATSAGSVAWANVSDKPSTFTPASHTHDYLPLSGGTLTGELKTTAANAIRLKLGGYGVMLRNDGSNFYFLITNKDDADGSWNSLRPLNFNLSTGVCNISGNAATATTATNATNATNATTASKLSTVSKTAWGLTYWTSGGVPTTISGAISSTGHITPSEANKSDIGSNTLYYRYGWFTWIGAPSSTNLIFGANNSNHALIDTSGNFRPYTSNSYALGTSSYYWKGAYIGHAGNIALSNLTYNAVGGVMYETTDNNRGISALLMYSNGALGNKVAGMPAAAVTLEYTTNGSTWVVDNRTFYNSGNSSTVNADYIPSIKRSIVFNSEWWYPVGGGKINNNTAGNPQTLTADAGSGNEAADAVGYGCRVTLDFTVENRTFYMSCIMPYWRIYGDKCDCTIEYYNAKNNAWTTIKTVNLNNSNQWRQLYLDRNYYVDGARVNRATVSSSDTTPIVNKLRFTVKITEKGAALASNSNARYFPGISSIYIWGPGGPNLTSGSTTISGLSSATVFKNSTRMGWVLSRYNVPIYLCSTMDRGGVRIPSNYLYIGDDLQYNAANTAKYATLTLGNSSNINAENAHEEGRIQLYSAATSYHMIYGASTTTAYTHTFPNATGWVATGGNGSSTGVGDATHPVYLSTSGVLTQCNAYPSKTSQLTNDSGYLTAHLSLANYVTLDGSLTITGNKTFSSTSLTMSCHYYSNIYDTNGNVYVHYYGGKLGSGNDDYTGTYSFANLRVKNGSSFRTLRFGGDGTLTWDGTSISLSGHTHSYLPLSGGTVTGYTTLSGGIRTGSIYYECDINGGTTGYGREINTFGGNLYLNHRGNLSSNGTGNVVMCTNGGKVGIGITDGAQKLHIEGGNVRISSSNTGAGGDVYLELWRGTNASWLFLNAAGTLYIRSNYSSAKQSSYGATGCTSISIGYNTGNITTNGLFYANSDIRYKDVIENINPTVEQISKLPIFNYKWNNRENDIVHTGSSAQAVELILPNLVSLDDNGFKSLDYATLGAIGSVTAAREIVKLKEENLLLKFELNKLKQEVENLKNKF